MFSHVGTKPYQAPEIFNNSNHTENCDLYSIGVILYQMATKQLPFGMTENQLAESYRNKMKVTFPENIEIDKELIDLINHLLTFTSEERYSWDEFFNHPYVREAMEEIDKSMPYLKDVYNEF